MKLSVNIDHVATLREQRKEGFPQPVFAAVLAEKAGADGITAHLSSGRRHTCEDDIILLRKVCRRLTLEMALTDAMVDFALKVKPDQITLVPETREELTTEGGLDVSKKMEEISKSIEVFHENSIDSSLFIEPEISQIECAAEVRSDIVEFHTGGYASAYAKKDMKRAEEILKKLREGFKTARKLNLRVHIGHGLTLENIEPFRNNELIEEASIGHSIVSSSIYEGFESAVTKMKEGIL